MPHTSRTGKNHRGTRGRGRKRPCYSNVTRHGFAHSVTGRPLFPFDNVSDVKKYVTRYSGDASSLLKMAPDNVRKMFSPALRAIVEPYIVAGKKLQPGIIYETIMCDAVASIFGLGNMTYDRDMLPDAIRESLVSHGINNERIVYYSDDADIVLVQEGAPDTVDASLLLDDGKVLHVEIKEPHARLGEHDFNINDDMTLASLKDESDSALGDVIGEIIDRATENGYRAGKGSNNYKLTREESVRIGEAYFSDKGIDCLISSNNDGEIICITRECLSEVNSISLAGGEIRRIGKNHRRANADERNQVINAIENGQYAYEYSDDGNRITISGDGVTKAMSRGGNDNASTLSRIYFNDFNVALVMAKNLVENDDSSISFNVSDIELASPSIAAHINFKGTSPDEVNKYLKIA